MVLIAAALLLLGGITLVVFNARKLISDWPRPKPRHNVDLAWIQVYLGLALIVVAWFIGADPARALREPIPRPVNAETVQNQPAAAATKR
ncbi:MAG TPA: hypothetical protein VHE61_16330 [Opitutaceae bacterium]|nr:hypothetical protein [Opitutaceae bacterium]